MNFHLELPSPRTGEAPPALSPLDAFAFHSRILAQQFEQEQNGRRISRLPPTAVAEGLVNRLGYFRNMSEAGEMGTSDLADVDEESSPSSPAAKGGVAITNGEDMHRPVSHYPMMGNMKQPGLGPAETPFFDAKEGQDKSPPQDYFGLGVPRASSPEPVDPRLNVEAPSPMVPSLTNSVDSVSSSHPRTLTNGSSKSQRSVRSDRGLLPPKSPAYPKSPRSMQNIRSARQDSGDEDNLSYHGGYASYRKQSGSSNMSRPHSPFSPYMQPVPRSPSMTSDYSMTSSAPHAIAHRHQNFSRPRSSGGSLSQPSVDLRPSCDSRPSFDTTLSSDLPHRFPSSSSHNTRPTYSANTSRQNSEDDFAASLPTAFPRMPDASDVPLHVPSHEDPSQASSTYIYSKYTLPRGRPVDRSSADARTSWINRQFNWDEKPTPGFPTPESEPEPHPTRLREDSDASTFSAPVRPASPTGSTESERISGMRLSRRDLFDSSSANRSKSANPETRTPIHQSSASVNTESTDRTLRPGTTHSEAPTSAEMSAEQHLEVGIQAHTSGALNKSTYHLRIAANAGLPTAMLLYALACRHGWGMRPNQEEGVKWLKKAIDGSGLELVDVEDQISSAARSPKTDPVAEAAERRKRKAQFALAIYELGISYMNGWGCAKDKSLALRCYEVAGNWGDCDALAEAGYCYTQGVGCKKDLKKAAGLYRKAAELGMSMAGNSWIYKPKYMDDPSPKSLEKDKKQQQPAAASESITEGKEKPAGRSRARSIWSRKKEKA